MPIIRSKTTPPRTWRPPPGSSSTRALRVDYPAVARHIRLDDGNADPHLSFAGRVAEARRTSRPAAAFDLAFFAPAPPLRALLPHGAGGRRAPRDRDAVATREGLLGAGAAGAHDPERQGSVRARGSGGPSRPAGACASPPSGSCSRHCNVGGSVKNVCPPWRSGGVRRRFAHAWWCGSPSGAIVVKVFAGTAAGATGPRRVLGRPAGGDRRGPFFVALVFIFRIRSFGEVMDIAAAREEAR